MNIELSGSDLTRIMLERGDKQVWCAVSNDSDDNAMSIIKNTNDNFIMYIVAFKESYFFCNQGEAWQYAVPVKKTELTQHELGL